MEVIKQLPYGYRCYTGVILPDCHVDSLNAIYQTINGFIEANMPVPEYLLFGANNLFKSYSARK